MNTLTPQRGFDAASPSIASDRSNLPTTTTIAPLRHRAVIRARRRRRGFGGPILKTEN